jgi:hypothetical protein
MGSSHSIEETEIEKIKRERNERERKQREIIEKEELLKERKTVEEIETISKYSAFHYKNYKIILINKQKIFCNQFFDLYFYEYHCFIENNNNDIILLIKHKKKLYISHINYGIFNKLLYETKKKLIIEKKYSIEIDEKNDNIELNFNGKLKGLLKKGDNKIDDYNLFKYFNDDYISLNNTIDNEITLVGNKAD